MRDERSPLGATEHELGPSGFSLSAVPYGHTVESGDLDGVAVASLGPAGG